MRRLQCFKANKNCAICKYWTGKTVVLCSSELNFCIYEFSLIRFLKAVFK